MSWLREGNHDKAWNDPPVFSYDSASAAQATHKRTSLNKRVAFPLSSTIGSQPSVKPGHGPPPMVPGGPPPMVPGGPPMVPGGPPPMAPCGPPLMVPAGIPPMVPGGPPMVPLGTSLPVPVQVPASGDQDSPEASPDGEDNSSILTPDEVKGKLSSLLGSLSHVEAKLKEDIMLRTEVLSSVWTSGNLSNAIKSRITHLLNVLERGSVSEADRLQRSLMVDYPAECSAWMPGVRQLISRLRAEHTTTTGQDQTQEGEATPSAEGEATQSAEGEATQSAEDAAVGS